MPMPTQVTNYKCPSCGGPLHFDPETQKLKCDYCGTLYNNDEIEKYYEEKNNEAVEVSLAEQDHFDVLQWSDEEKQHLRAYSCPSCGAQLMCDENTAATACPYCGNPTVVPAQFAGTLKPDLIIPFKLKKEDAIAALNKFYHGKPFLPNVFTDQNHIEEIKGIYVPFWLYDGTANANVAYHATKTHVYTTANEQVTVTDHYRVRRAGTVAFQHVPADASSKMPDEFMDALEPFLDEDLVPFQLSYLPGYYADKYDVPIRDTDFRVEVRMRNTAYDEIRDSVNGGYSSVVPETQQLHLRKEDINYAFFPIWLLTTRWNDKNYMFTMNGQTGKMIGDDLPVDKMKFFLYFIGLTLLFALIMGLLFIR